MWEWLSDGKNLQGIGSLVSAGGSIYGGIKQAEAAKDMLKLQNESFKFNKSLALEDEADKRRNRKAWGSWGGSDAKLEDSRVKDY